MHPVCVVFGHTFDDGSLEEEHEEREGGTVLRVREYRTCRRCGTEDELYRNEGILAPTADDAAEEGVDQSDKRADESAPSSAEPTIEPDTEPSDPSTPSDDGGEPAGDTDGSSPSDEPITDDAIILTESSAEPSATAGGFDDRRTSSVSADGGTLQRSAVQEVGANPSCAAQSINQRDDSEGALSCSSCAASVRTGNTPYRSGDLCPSCQAGYLR